MDTRDAGKLGGQSKSPAKQQASRENGRKGGRPPYQPKTGLPCHCKPGMERDNCPQCEGTGMQIDFAAIRARS